MKHVNVICNARGSSDLKSDLCISRDFFILILKCYLWVILTNLNLELESDDTTNLFLSSSNLIMGGEPKNKFGTFGMHFMSSVHK